jgi:hypothetical protein
VKKRQRFLGLYLLVMGAAQVFLYLWMVIHSDSSLFYYDPRIAIFFIESIIAGEEFARTGFLRWFTVAVPLIFGMRFLMGQNSRMYLTIEVILSLPFVIFSSFVLLANMSPSHGFSIRELTLPIVVFLLFSAVPTALAIQLRRF